MKYKVIVVPGAEADYLRIYAYLKVQFGPKSAARFKATFGKIIKALRRTPKMYAPVPEIPGIHKCTALSPTLVLYNVIEKERRVEILTLYDGRSEMD
ncbi:MAG: ParE toxin of type toxin-antitoxin system, parDE [Bacteroidota bacterium]